MRRRRIVSEEEGRMQRGSKLPVIHSNASSAPFPLAQPGEQCILRAFSTTTKKIIIIKGLGIRVFALADSWSLVLAAN